MASEGGVEIPVPPKRPTVIRASKTQEPDSTVSPERPAPPVPSRPAPAVPARTNGALPGRPAVPVPARPSDRPRPGLTGTSRPPPPIPGRIGEATPVVKGNGTSQTPAQSQSTSSKTAGGKPKPEITIVCARPMSEVGFRGQSTDDTNLSKATEDSKPDSARPQRPKSLHPQPEQPLIQFDEEPPPEGSNHMPPRGPPPVLPSGLRLGAPPPTAPRRPSPSSRISEKSPVPARRDLDEPASDPDPPVPDSGPRGVNPKLGVPLPPVPRNPPAPSRPPQVNSAPKVPQHSDNLSQSTDFIKSDDSGDVTNQEHSDSPPSDGNSDMYAVINKPRRPTIIRPGRPSVKENRSEPPKIPPKISPRLDDSDNDDDKSDNVNDETPDFLKLKLKSTIKNSTGTQGSEKNSTDIQPPQLAPKPKPTVLPKPKIAAKPIIANKPVIAKKSEQITNDNKEGRAPNTSSQTVHNDNVNKVENDSDSSLPKRPPPVKRPTIIRPARPAQFGSSDNIKQETSQSDQGPVSGSVDDSAVKTRPQPPLPTKRPVSMTNIPQALAQEVAAMSHRTSSSHSVNTHLSSAENLNNTPQQQQQQPKPVPRPVARTRPMSMAAGDMSSLHATRPSVSPRLQGKSDSEHHTSDKPGSEQPHKPLPPKPARQPMKAVPSSASKVSSSSDDEFVEALTKPDRPNAPPLFGQRQSMKEAGEMKKSPPPRPGGPPSKKQTAQEQEKGPDSESVAMRPGRPSTKPSRPMSMPVKSVLPSKPQLPKGDPGQKKKYGLPSLPARPGPGHPAYHHMMCVPHGQALFDYTARHEDELSFKQGEVIILVRVVDTEWVMGKVDDQEGMFPRGFVKVLMPIPGEKLMDESSDENEEYYDTSPEKPDTLGHGPRCRARFDFEGEGSGDLAFEEGDVIRLLERVGTEWRKGECNGRTGLFPLGYVEVIEDLPEDDLNITSPVVKALFDFDGEQGDLSFQAGETINVTHQVNEEWLFGEIGNRKGQFPIQFIDHVPVDLPPLPQEAKQEFSPIQNTQHTQQSSHTDMIAGAMGQWDTDTEPRSEPTITEDSPYCIATYDYPGQTADDLGFSEGDRIEIIERINSDWLKGKLHGIVGMFPAAFVEVKVDMPVQGTDTPPPTTDEPEGQVAVALYEFHGEADNELSFEAGDQLIVQELVEGAEDWRWGVHCGKRGIFPATFVNCAS